jgi:hypothetical protein
MDKQLSASQIWRLAHKDRSNAIAKKYRDSHKEQRRIIGKNYRDNNKGKTKAYRKQWLLDHPGYISPCQRDPDKLREYRKKTREKRRSTLRGKLDRSSTFGIWRALKCHAKAGRKWEQLFGYTLSALMDHLEKQFDSNMSWKNYGNYWGIDHIVPISAFNYETSDDIDFKRCWSLSNLQPLEKIANIKKRDKVIIPFQPSLLI